MYLMTPINRLRAANGLEFDHSLLYRNGLFPGIVYTFSSFQLPAMLLNAQNLEAK